MAAEEDRVYHTIVVGLGAMGSAALYHLAKQGVKVLGLEAQPQAPHESGSSHGHSRIIRLSYHEGPHYTPLLKRAYQLWGELQQQTGEELLVKTGYLDITLDLSQRRAAGDGARSNNQHCKAQQGEAQQAQQGDVQQARQGKSQQGEAQQQQEQQQSPYCIFTRSLASAKQQGIEHEVLSGRQASDRFPAFSLPDEAKVLFQPDGGILAPERCIAAHLQAARDLGADIILGAPLASWRVIPDAEGLQGRAPAGTGHGTAGMQAGAGGNGHNGIGEDLGVGELDLGSKEGCVKEMVEVEVEEEEEEGDVGGGGQRRRRRRRRFRASRLLLTPGAWIGKLVPELAAVCRPQRQVVGFFEVQAAARDAFRPSAMPVFSIGKDKSAWYGFPEYGQVLGFKIGKFHHLHEACDPDTLDREDVRQQDEQVLRDAVSRYLPRADGAMTSSSVCMFTNTPDGDFLIDWHPRHRGSVLLCSACSGHGFKMASSIGEALSTMLLAGAGRPPPEQISHFALLPQRPGFGAVLRDFAAS